LRRQTERKKLQLAKGSNTQSTDCTKVKRDEKMSHLQKEIYWIVLLAMFFIERDVILDTMFAILNIIYDNFK